jgi:phosphomannomutase
LATAIRAKQVGTCGVMITASHNLYEDNGVKIIEPNGGMLVQRWEEMMEHLVNVQDISNFLDLVSSTGVKAWPLEVNIFANEPIPPPV